MLPSGSPLRIELHGAAYVWYYQPLSTLDDPKPGIKPLTTSDGTLDLYLASLELTARLDDFGLLLNPRFRDTKAREFFTSNVWVQQAYAFYERPTFTIKAGKIENLLSRLWDDTFYASMPYFDGLKQEMDYGLSVEGSVESKSGLGLAYDAQYFFIDGHTNGSLRDRDPAWIEGARRHHIAVLRIEPSYRVSPRTSVRLGVAGQYSRVDLGVGPKQNVFRIDTDVSLAAGPVKVFGEFIAQIGRTVLNYPVEPVPATGTAPAKAGQSSAHNFYGVVGGEVQIWRFLPRYSFSLVRYNDVGVTELLHIPGVTVTLHENVSLSLEYAYWPRRDPKRSLLLDSSFNAGLSAHF